MLCLFSDLISLSIDGLDEEQKTRKKATLLTVKDAVPEDPILQRAET